MPDVLAGLAKAYLRLGNDQEAVAYLKQAIALEPENSNFHYQLGRAFL